MNNKEETKVTRFDKEKQNLSRTQERNQTPSICSTSSGSMKSEAEPKSVQTREMRNDVKRLDQRSRDSSPESPSLTTGNEEAAKAPSITWDMEKESYVTKNASTVSRSVILDTTHLVWSRKAQKAEFGKDTEDREAQTVTTIPCGASLISIGPSQSASQTRVDPLTPGMAQLSRYFSVPTEAPMVNSTESDASVRPTQERPPTHAPQAVTIPNEMGNTLEDATGDNAERNVLAEQYAPGFVAGLENFQEQPTRSLLLSIEDELQSHAGLEFTKDQPFNMAEATGIRIGTDYRAHSRTFSFNQSRESTELQNPNPILESAQEFSILPGYQQVEETFIPHYQLEEDVEPDIRGGAIWEDEFGEGHHEPTCDGLFLMPNASAETVVPHILDEYIENPSNPQFYMPDPTQVPQCAVEVTTGHLYDELEDEISFVRSVDGYSEESPITMQGNQDETMEGTESVMFSEGRVVGAAEFSHGRELLLGLANTNQLGSSRFQTMLKVEEDVAKSLKGHWTPQKY